MKKYLLLLWCCSFQFLNAQTSFPYSRFTDWQHAGLSTAFDSAYALIDMSSLNIDPTGQLDCAAILQNAINQNDHVIFKFPAGEFKFESPITLKAHQVLEGSGPASTHFIFNLGGSGSAFTVNGSIGQNITNVSGPIQKNQQFLVCPQHQFNSGDWLYLQTDDASLITSSWALGTTGQILQIHEVANDTLYLETKLRRSYSGPAWVKPFLPIEQVGFRCFSVERQDDTAPSQTSTFNLYATTNAFIESVYAYKCTFAHAAISCCSKISIRKNYFTEGFSYGGGGRAYGVVLQQTTGDCLVEDNIFKHLRHAILLQSGANGNVCTFNFSTDPYWQESLLTANSAGELVLHGNYPYSNLFEQNSIGNIVIDNSHGANGPDNLFYRNRASLYGIFFSDQSSPDQLFIGNEVTNTAFPYSLVNYSILGTGHYQFANNNKGTIVPTATQLVQDTSFAYTQNPVFVNPGVWLHIGDQPTVNYPIPAENRWLNQAYFSTSCGLTDLALQDWSVQMHCYPNPTANQLNVKCTNPYFGNLELRTLFGQTLLQTHMKGTDLTIDTERLQTGTYFLYFTDIQKTLQFVKIN